MSEVTQVNEVREAPELEKALNSWKHVISHSEGKLSKQMEEHIVKTIGLLEELKARRMRKELNARPEV